MQTTLKQTWDAEGGLVIGPFAFGAAGGSDSEHDTFTSSGSSVTLTNNGAWPYIVAFVSNWVVPPSRAALTGQASQESVIKRPNRRIARR